MCKYIVNEKTMFLFFYALLFWTPKFESTNRRKKITFHSKFCYMFNVKFLLDWKNLIYEHLAQCCCWLYKVNSSFFCFVFVIVFVYVIQFQSHTLRCFVSSSFWLNKKYISFSHFFQLKILVFILTRSSYKIKFILRRVSIFFFFWVFLSNYQASPAPKLVFLPL